MKNKYIKLYSHFYCHHVFYDKNHGNLAQLEEYDADFLNGGQPTGNYVFAKLGNAQCTEGSVDGIICWDQRYKYPLFKPCSVHIK